MRATVLKDFFCVCVCVVSVSNDEFKYSLWCVL